MTRSNVEQAIEIHLVARHGLGAGGERREDECALSAGCCLACPVAVRSGCERAEAAAAAGRSRHRDGRRLAGR